MGIKRSQFLMLFAASWLCASARECWHIWGPTESFPWANRSRRCHSFYRRGWVAVVRRRSSDDGNLYGTTYLLAQRTMEGLSITTA